ncbi:hypothetical protein CN918_26955 [Priestia megaterium]|nr:hypothetical protein CN918_26955 [Priestia megaterium]
MNVNAERNCDVTPDISVMKKMASISGSPASRILELVDNSIDARIKGLPLIVDVNVVKRRKQEYIEVKDNGKGMTELVARSYFRLGDSQKSGKGKIGKFGLGSKVAILGLGDTCEIETKPYEENYSVNFNFDIRRFKKWSVPYQVTENTDGEHGTTIRIKDITIRIGNVQRFCDRLQEQFAKIYKHFIQHEDVIIRVNGQPVSAIETELLPGFYKSFDFEIDGKRVYGWCGAKKDTGANWKFGFDLVSNGRIIKQNDFLTRVAHQSLSRLTGEIHLDDFETDVHKTDFIRHNPSFEKMQERLLQTEIADMITNISKLTSREVFEKYHRDMKQVSTKLNKVLNSYEFLNQLDIEDGIFKKMKRKKQKTEDKKEAKQNQTFIPEQEKEETYEDIFADLIKSPVKEEYEEVEVVEEAQHEPEKPKRQRVQSGLVVEEPIGVSAGYEQPPRRWIAVEKGDAMYLNVEVNIDHPSYASLDEGRVAVQMQNAVMDSVAEFILEEEKKQSVHVESDVERLNQLKDMLIRCSVSV